MELKSTLFAVIIISLMTISIGVIIANWNNEYGSGIISDLDKDLNKLGDVSNTASSQQGSLNPDSPEASSDYEAETYKGGYGIITSIYTPLRVVFGTGGMFQAIGHRFGLPTWLISALVSMFIISITFAIVAIIFRAGKEAV